MANKNCCAPGFIDCAPGLKYLDTPVCVREYIFKEMEGLNALISQNIKGWEMYMATKILCTGVYFQRVGGVKCFLSKD